MPGQSGYMSTVTPAEIAAQWVAARANADLTLERAIEMLHECRVFAMEGRRLLLRRQRKLVRKRAEDTERALRETISAAEAHVEAAEAALDEAAAIYGFDVAEVRRISKIPRVLRPGVVAHPVVKEHVREQLDELCARG